MPGTLSGTRAPWSNSGFPIGPKTAKAGLGDCARKQGSSQNWPRSRLEGPPGQRGDIFSIKKNNDCNVLKSSKYRKQ